jgi:hypothetical protein
METAYRIIAHRPEKKRPRVVEIARRLRMLGAISPLPPYAFMAWCIIKHREIFTFC